MVGDDLPINYSKTQTFNVALMNKERQTIQLVLRNINTIMQMNSPKQEIVTFT